MHYVYILRDTALKSNSIEIAPSLRGVDKRLREDRRFRKRHKKTGELLLVYYECLKSPGQAKKRKSFLKSKRGAREARRWLLRWDRTEVHE